MIPILESTIKTNNSVDLAIFISFISLAWTIIFSLYQNNINKKAKVRDEVKEIKNFWYRTIFIENGSFINDTFMLYDDIMKLLFNGKSQVILIEKEKLTYFQEIKVLFRKYQYKIDIVDVMDKGLSNELTKIFDDLRDETTKYIGDNDNIRKYKIDNYILKFNKKILTSIYEYAKKVQ